MAAILEAVTHGPVTGAVGAGAALLEPLRANPSRAAILTDVDGTLAPIAARPEGAATPPRARAALARLAARYAVVGCVSGRRALEARRLVGVEGIAYAGNHGLELLAPGDEEPRPDPALAGRERAAADFVAGLSAPELAATGIRLEDKGPIQALHWRGAADEEGAEARARRIAAAAEAAGLAPHWGRKVLELRPPGAGGKGAAVAALLAGHDLEAVVYGGDDRTDLDAFRRLRALRDTGLRAVCVGIDSTEAPPELASEADLLLAGPDRWIDLLESLVSPPKS